MTVAPDSGEDRAGLMVDGDPVTVRTVFQPIVDLCTGAVVGYEALSRGPEGSELEAADSLFAAAQRQGVLPELDWMCRVSALEAARQHALSRSARLFINVEPASFRLRLPEKIEQASRLGARDFHVTAELTERDLTSRPAETLLAISRLRAMGWSIAFDDVGADPRSLAMLPVMRPDVVKLDRSIVGGAGSAHAAHVMAAVGAYAEHTGAALLVEGIEREPQIDAALALGGQLGQGWHFGHPAIHPDGHRAGAPWPIAERPPARPTKGSAWDLVRRRRTPRRGTTDVLVAMSRHLEQIAGELGDGGTIVSVIERDGAFPPSTRRRYARMAERLSLVAVLSATLGPRPAAGVRGAMMDADDPLALDWVVAVLGHHFAAALVGREASSDPSSTRRFDYVLTHDRDLVGDIFATVASRISPTDFE